MTDVLVTGATGFIGRHLVPLLAGRGANVVAMLRPSRPIPAGFDALPNVSWAHCDITDSAQLRKTIDDARPVSIINLAVARSASESETFAVGSAAVVVLTEAATANGSHLVQVASSTEAGDEPPTDHHGVAKLEASRHVNAWIHSSNSGAVLRPFLVYGPGEPRHRFLPTAINAALNAVPLPMTTANFGRDYVWVGDVAECLSEVALNQMTFATTRDICTGTTTGNHDLVTLVEDITNRTISRVPDAFGLRPWDRSNFHADPTTTIELLGRPPISLQDGLKRCLQTPEWVE